MHGSMSKKALMAYLVSILTDIVSKDGEECKCGHKARAQHLLDQIEQGYADKRTDFFEVALPYLGIPFQLFLLGAAIHQMNNGREFEEQEEEVEITEVSYILGLNISGDPEDELDLMIRNAARNN